MSDYDKERLQNESCLDPPLGLSDSSSDLPRTRDVGDLDKTLVRGVAWTAAVKWSIQVFTWGATVVVARVLLPADYGLVGMAALYINLLTLFSEFGIGNAVVTLQDLTGDQLSQLNCLSLFVGLIGFASGVGLLDERVEAGCAGAVRTASLWRSSAFCL